MFMGNSDDEVFVVEPDNPIVPLDNQDPEFLRGVEVGIMWQNAYFGFMVHLKIHVSNIEMVMRIAEAYEMTFTAEESDEEDKVIVTMIPPDESEYLESEED